MSTKTVRHVTNHFKITKYFPLQNKRLKVANLENSNNNSPDNKTFHFSLAKNKLQSTSFFVKSHRLCKLDLAKKQNDP